MPIIENLLDRIGLSNDRILLSALEQLAEGVIVADDTGRLVFVNSAAAEIHGVKRLDVEPDDYSEAYQLLTSDGAPYPSHDLPLARAVLKGETVTDAHWKIRRPDGRIVDAVGTARPIYNEAKEQVGSVLTVSDRTEEFAALHERDAALAAKEAMLFEVNHRVKNNLALVSALLRLQAKSVSDPEAQAAFRDLSGRITVLEDLHRRLYQTGGHTEIEIVSFLSENVTDSARALSMDKQIRNKVRSSGTATLPVDRAVPLALALNELLLNSVKHAFADTAEPEIRIAIEVRDATLKIVYEDNGCGLPETPAASAKGIGRALISNLSAQLDATMEVETDRDGFCTTMVIPLDR